MLLIFIFWSYVAFISSKMFKVQNRDETQEKVIGFNFASICLQQPSKELALISEMVRLISFSSFRYHFHYFHVH